MLRRRSRQLVRFAVLIAAIVVVLPAGPAARQTQTPSAREIIDRFVKAAGGTDALKAIKSMRGVGTLAIPSQGMTGSVELLAARPNKAVLRVTIDAIGKIETGYDGVVGWSIDPVSGPALVKGKELAERADDAWFDATLHEAARVKEMTVLGRDTFDGKAAYKVKVVMVSGLERTEYFDVETGLQIGQEGIHATPMGEMPGTTIFREYKTFGKVKLPVTLVERILGIEQVLVFTNYEFDTVPPNSFDLPAVIKALIK